MASYPAFSANVLGIICNDSANLAIEYWSKPGEASPIGIKRLASSICTAPAPGTSLPSLTAALNTFTALSNLKISIYYFFLYFLWIFLPIDLSTSSNIFWVLPLTKIVLTLHLSELFLNTVTFVLPISSTVTSSAEPNSSGEGLP